MKRTIDIVLATVALAALSIPLALIAAAVKLSSRGPVLYWSYRVGRDNRLFRMPKFRTMRVDTPEVATHLLSDSHRWITPFGQLLRKTSLDELPQLWTVLVGDMSLVGPRPALYNQSDLIAARTAVGVHKMSPGVTGWAQINGRDELPIPAKVHYDRYYQTHQSARLDLWILLLTFGRVIRQDGIRQADQPQAVRT